MENAELETSNWWLLFLKSLAKIHPLLLGINGEVTVSHSSLFNSDLKSIQVFGKVLKGLEDLAGYLTESVIIKEGYTIKRRG